MNAEVPSKGSATYKDSRSSEDRGRLITMGQRQVQGAERDKGTQLG